MTSVTHRFIETNSIKMHIAEQGQGKLVILCHGFPESWYSWRHQLSALAEAGFHAVAPDQRGYGQTDRPEAIEAYHVFQLVGDIVGLVNALGEEQAFIVGHDWGALVAWYCALLRPDMFRALTLLSVPYLPRTWDDIRPTEAMKLMAGEQEFYQLYFQEPGKAEAELESDVRTSIRAFLYSASGDPPPSKRWRFLFSKSEKLLDTCSVPDKLPTWLTEQDIDFFTSEFERTGFRGGLNWYRNMDRIWELNPFLSGAKIRQPTLFVAGEADAVITMYREAFDTLEQNVPNLRQKVLLPGAGHWVQQERPVEVNKLLIEFLADHQIDK
ncbi:alpha/beta fold hydrolase [Cylindrospermum sp. FACHB-282]|uniref:alpha/beta fold hydrolase n=1 Tax=Cylindrospermum sp. FACHB-282 TaxID=2692794 RepID=UPI001688BEA3|nr:alpha/beta hydrolase [Cylindrospermum sp. FACHB-282]MBD2387554.1 alpha/beta hydrolase [Cylindrospermum sp. FACHB-282]